MAKPQPLILLCLALLAVAACEKHGKDRKEGRYPEFTAVTEDNLSAWEPGQEVSVCDNFGGRAVYVTRSAGHSVPLDYVSGDRLKEGGGVVYRANCPPSSSPDGDIAFFQTLSSPDDMKGMPLQARGTAKTLEFHPNSGSVILSFEGFSPVQAVLELGEGNVVVSVPSNLSQGLVWLPEGEHRFKSTGFVTSGRKIAYLQLDSTINVKSSEPASLPVMKESDAASPDTHLSGNTRTSNCYIYGPSQSCRFYARCRGNGGMTADEFSPVWADLLWQDGSIFPPLCDGSYIYFAGRGEAGNALVAARDRSGDILWTWHLWASAETPAGVNTSAGTLMDRNLGALSAAKGDSLAAGLYYQWGRKEPLAPGSGIWQQEAAPDNAWSDAAKTLNDPCPDGWRVPAGGGHGVSSSTMSVSRPVLEGFWNKYFGDSAPSYGKGYWAAVSGGLGGIQPASTLWIPASGELDSSDGSPRFKGKAGSLWTTRIYGNYAICLAFSEAGNINPAAWSRRTAARAIRCIKE